MENFPLMSSVEGLDNAMIGKVAMKASEKMRIKAINNTGTYTDGILLLA